MAIILTGATGLLGSHLLCHLTARSGDTVIALKREESRVEETRALFSRYFSCPEEALSRVTWVVGDVLDVETVIPVMEKADTLYHCAAMVSFNEGDRDTLLKTNIEGTKNICRLCLEHQVRLCFVSSIAALGDAPGERVEIDENTPEIPGRVHSLYSTSKGESEKVVWEYIREGLDAVIVNPAIILGTSSRGRSSAGLFDHARKGMPFYTDGVSGYVDVRDVCDLMIRLTEKRELRGERFVLCEGNYSYKELFSAMARVVGKRPPFIHMTPWMTAIAWRLLAFFALFTGKKPSFTRETARASQRESRYSAKKVLSLFPDFRFHTLEETTRFLKDFDD